MATLESALSAVVRGNPAAATLAEQLGVYTVGQLLSHYPRRYVHRGELTSLRDLPLGEEVTVLARVTSVSVREMLKRPGTVTSVIISDGRDKLTLTFFSKRGHRIALSPGWEGLFAGKVRLYQGERELTHPDFSPVQPAEGAGGAVRRAGARPPVRPIVPIYPATAKLASWRIASAVEAVLDQLGAPEDPLPEQLREAQGLLPLGQALRTVHVPVSDEDLQEAIRRLKWDEALVLQTVLAQRKHAAGRDPAVACPARPDGLLAAFDASLPFDLTAGQREVGAQILGDMAKSSPMQRLLQGEVGSGKTVVALRAMLAAVDAGGQAVLLAPTEVLAVQHLRSVRALLGPLGLADQLGGAERATRVDLLTGATPAARRRELLAALAEGSVGIVVGTHALLEQEVRFRNLALVVVDEQHRFGVVQRDALRTRAPVAPHLLVMSATPIPRTVAMTVFGDLETSALVEVPAGRGRLTTHLVPTDAPSWTVRMWARVREEVAAGRQAFVVCPRIGDEPPVTASSPSGPDGEEADPTGGQAVLEVAPALEAGPLQGLRLGVLHGRLSSEAKDAVMGAFTRGEVDVLVATTVVEVGVDVPNATAMVVLDADRFGISQLHQLRGRVGRGGAAAVCLLATGAPPGSKARERVAAVAGSTDGFELARLDLAARREGDVLGAAQSGHRTRLRLLSLEADEELLVAARRCAVALVAANPQLSGHPALQRAIEAAFAPETAAFLEKV